MTWRVTIKTSPTCCVEYVAIGSRDALMDAAYEAGALGVSVRMV